MSIDNSTVKKVASLARIEVKSDEEDTIINELNNIIGWVDELQKINTDNVEPMLSVFNEPMNMRKDNPKSNYSNEMIMKNSPKSNSGFFVVPKVVE
jgi:aspartyl-tRNA(Asn)/glutamyl-tRNA(Gln) amidotransferase subunit C